MFGRHLIHNLTLTANHTKYFMSRPRRNQKDYYKILQLSPYATSQQIKNNYYALCKNYHPDLSQNSQQQMIKLNQAYEVLSNPTQRQKYDQQRGIKKQKVAQNNPFKQTAQNTQSSDGRSSFGRVLMGNFLAGIVITTIFILIFGPRQQRKQRSIQQNNPHYPQNQQQPTANYTQGFNRNTASGYKHSPN